MLGRTMVNGLKLPEEFRERIEALRDGRVQPPAARHAATVALLRDHPEHGLQVYMLRRTASMAFAPGMYVFPGGSVDPRDGDAEIGWTGPGPDHWAKAFRADEKVARELVCAAVRETFEESLVLLAGPTAESVVDDTRGPGWEADRQALLDRSQSLAEFLTRRGLVLRADLLRPWGHWITPEAEIKRFDTRFFVAAIPPGQQTGDVSTEADRVAWLRPSDAIDRARRGELAMLPPTVATLRSLADFGSVPEVLAAEREIVVYQPEGRIIDGEPWLVLPGGEAEPYPGL